MHLTSHIIAHMAMPPYIAHYRSYWFDQRFLFRFRLFGNNPPNAHRSQIKMCEKRQTRNVQFRFMQNAFRILKPIQKSLKCIWVFRNTGANAFAKNQLRLAYEDKRDLYCIQHSNGRYDKNNDAARYFTLTIMWVNIRAKWVCWWPFWIEYNN